MDDATGGGFVERRLRFGELFRTGRRAADQGLEPGSYTGVGRVPLCRPTQVFQTGLDTLGHDRAPRRRHWCSAATSRHSSTLGGASQGGP